MRGRFEISPSISRVVVVARGRADHGEKFVRCCRCVYNQIEVSTLIQNLSSVLLCVDHFSPCPYSYFLYYFSLTAITSIRIVQSIVIMGRGRRVTGENPSCPFIENHRSPYGKSPVPRGPHLEKCLNPYLSSECSKSALPGLIRFLGLSCISGSHSWLCVPS